MNHSHFIGHNDALRNNVKSLFELSARKDDDAPQTVGSPLHALAENGAAAKLLAIDFDKASHFFSRRKICLNTLRRYYDGY